MKKLGSLVGRLSTSLKHQPLHPAFFMEKFPVTGMTTKTGKLSSMGLPLSSVVKVRTLPICSEQFIVDAKP